MEDLEEKIRDIEAFTCEYWWPLYERWEADHEWRGQTPTFGRIILDTIEQRGRYVSSIREYLRESNASTSEASTQ